MYPSPEAGPLNRGMAGGGPGSLQYSLTFPCHEVSRKDPFALLEAIWSAVKNMNGLVAVIVDGGRFRCGER
jgi:hypothetical protein